MAFNFFQKFSQKKGTPKAPILKNEEGDRRIAKQEFSDRQKKSAAEKGVSRAQPKGNNVLAAMLIVGPHISEKSTGLEQAPNDQRGPSYTFRVTSSATKLLLKKAIENRYDVKVSRVRIINAPSRTMRRGKIIGHVPGFKKAIVVLEKNYSIDSL